MSWMELGKIFRTFVEQGEQDITEISGSSTFLLSEVEFTILPPWFPQDPTKAERIPPIFLPVDRHVG